MEENREILGQLTLHYVQRYGQRVKSLGLVDPSRDPIPDEVLRQLNSGRWYADDEGNYFCVGRRVVHLGTIAEGRMVLVTVRPKKTWNPDPLARLEALRITIVNQR